MYKTLRIIFCILAVALAAAAIFIFAYFDWWWGALCVVCAAVFGCLMVTFKMLQEKKERKDNPAPRKGDFIFGKVSDTEKKDEQ